MRSSTRQTIARLSLIAAFVFSSGCGTTLSPVKRAPVQISGFETSLPLNPEKVLIRFESTLPGTPLAETVWDNVTGAVADLEESKQIGFTQNYSMLVPAAAVGGIIGGAVVGTQPGYTRIVIPFGRIFENMLLSGLQKIFPNLSTCFDDLCEREKLRSLAPRYVVRLKVSEFQVWEAPLNHLNMKGVVECKAYRASMTNQPSHSYDARHQVTNQPLGSIMTTSSGFIKEMNTISNEFAGKLSEQLLSNLQKELSD
jgi:hypothetical protein